MILSAFANQVQEKGRTKMQTPPMTWYNPMNAAIEIRNKSQ
jgi:hypothetical protein